MCRPRERDERASVSLPARPLMAMTLCSELGKRVLRRRNQARAGGSDSVKPVSCVISGDAGGTRAPGRGQGRPLISMQWLRLGAFGRVFFRHC